MLEHRKNHRLWRLWYLLLAGHFLFVFCAVDFLHAEDCPYVDGIPTGADDGCAACLFKVGAHAEQPEFVAALAPLLFLEEQVAVLIESVQSNEPACCLYLRAPPA